ncbi:MAG: hypothetical protein A2822_04425 [Candidatus Staskawiczbacteria bacterium RIFCSPHIGHO2_01_FULL_41_41]|uniref:Uncharacterized protein n=1 Tax=Candidatus Staskawiczbacteria bacterium RIFCSPHIGHO2_01_FULL_41_41 TaxID=1802203 RepID=A0A1G2HV74_9BACT|nr:MAG: hypothetical protein A2822_04425 [Candidatus Staskawiczbacteria bacterium RIFCSPHIGHO2_01_FULL_41_41]HLD79056.1 hypothetical protein [Candidatus Nanoarchaeia archaeon]
MGKIASPKSTLDVLRGKYEKNIEYVSSALTLLRDAHNFTFNRREQEREGWFTNPLCGMWLPYDQRYKPHEIPRLYLDEISKTLEESLGIRETAGELERTGDSDKGFPQIISATWRIFSQSGETAYLKGSTSFHFYDYTVGDIDKIIFSPKAFTSVRFDRTNYAERSSRWITLPDKVSLSTFGDVVDREWKLDLARLREAPSDFLAMLTRGLGGK